MNSQEFLVDSQFENLLYELKANKLNDRSEQDRYWAITITEVEKARAIFLTYCLLKEEK